MLLLHLILLAAGAKSAERQGPGSCSKCSNNQRGFRLAQVLAAVTFPATDGKQIIVKKQKSPREKPGSTYQTTANGNCLAANAAAMPGIVI